MPQKPPHSNLHELVWGTRLGLSCILGESYCPYDCYFLNTNLAESIPNCILKFALLEIRFLSLRYRNLGEDITSNMTRLVRVCTGSGRFWTKIHRRESRELRGRNCSDSVHFSSEPSSYCGITNPGRFLEISTSCSLPMVPKSSPRTYGASWISLSEGFTMDLFNKRKSRKVFQLKQEVEFGDIIPPSCSTH